MFKKIEFCNSNSTGTATVNIRELHIQSRAEKRKNKTNNGYQKKATQKTNKKATGWDYQGDIPLSLASDTVQVQ